MQVRDGVEGVERDAPAEVDGLVRRNVQALLEARARFERKKGVQEKIADTVTAFTGSLLFVLIHAILFGGWILLNLGLIPGVEPFDPFPFVMLAMIASVEAIFLSTFVLISQNRMAVLNDKRADLDLQVNLLAEHEITKLIEIVDGIARHVGARGYVDPRVEELKRDVRPEEVLEEIERIERIEQKRADEAG